jgi:single-strand DNA-binding protein
MNEITLHGNLTAEPVHRRSTTRSATSFSIAVNNGYYDRRTGQYVSQQAVFHHVVCFGDLADNTAATLRKGSTVTVTGQFSDDSYTAEGGQRIRRTRLTAADVAVSLRWATAAITRRGREADAAAETDTPGQATDAQVAEPTPQPAAAA